MLMPRFSFAYIRIDMKVYVIGGGNSDPDGNLIVLERCEYFDLDKKTWNNISNLPISLISSTALNVNNNLYVFGGI